MKPIFANLLYIIFILFGIFMCIQVVLILTSNAKECLDNSFVYGAKEQMKGEVFCSCTEYKDGELFYFYFNETDWWSKPSQNTWANLELQ